MSEKVFDYASPGEKRTVIMVVRPLNKYGDAPAGCKVKIDIDEMRRGPTAEALWTVKNQAAYDAIRAEEAKRIAAPPPMPVRDAIHAALRHLGVAPAPVESDQDSRAAAVLPVSVAVAPPPIPTAKKKRA